MLEARKYYLENVIPNYRDFIEYRKSNIWGENQLLRRAFIAATSLFHLREYIPAAIQPTKSILVQQYPNYGLVGDIANASKHSILKDPNSQILNASQISEQLRYIKFKDDLGDYFVPQLEVYVKLNNGSEHRVINILYDTLSMWNDVLDSLNIIDKTSINPLDIDKMITRDEAEKIEAGATGTEGEQYKWLFRMEEYNYVTNVIEPMDLTGWEFKMQLQKLPEVVSIIWKMNLPSINLSTEIPLDIPLSSDQAEKYISIQDEQDQMIFINEIIQSTPSIHDDLNRKLQALVNVHLANQSPNIDT